MKIALDALGGDAGATPLVEGAVMAARKFPGKILLVGRQHSLRRLLRHFKYKGRRIQIVPCSDSVKMSTSPTDSLKQKQSSIAVAARLVREGEAHGIVSAGNTGAALAHSLSSWRRLKGCSRPGIAAVMPVPERPCLLLDVGANVDCRPRHLLDFAVMGSVYSREVLGCKNPEIGLLSVGEEPSKGNELTRETYTALQNSHLNFVGNVEGRDVFNASVDVIVCDGFVGNVLLKFGEGLASMIMTGVKGAMKRNVFSLAGALMVSPGMRKFKKQIDYAEYGGAPLLGLNGVCIISHGSSNPRAVMNAIRVARESVEHSLNDRILTELKKVGHGQRATNPSREAILAGIPES
jgi:glycerol-3-phosphate acyltransferase PlsX